MAEKHFVLTEETQVWCGHTLHRIKATRDIPTKHVSAGELGGWVEKEANLSGKAWVYGDAQVYGNAKVYGDAKVYGTARVYGDAKVYGTARVYGDAQVYGNAKVYGDAQVYGIARVYGDAQVYGNARVFGIACVYGTAKVYGNACVYGNAWEKSPLQIQGTRWFCNMATDKIWRMGCCHYPLAEWVERYDEITAEQRQEDIKEEYWRYVRLACEMYAPELLEGK